MPDYDARLVDLYDQDNPDGPDHDFYRSLADVRGARAIVDLGCGTGLLTVTFAAKGRRVVGVDPSPAMLDFARRRPGASGVEWIEGDSASIPDGDFDLAVMTGNVAQHIGDADWTRTLADLRRSLRAGGTLAFESRNPAARAWEDWDSPERTRRQTPHGVLEEWMDASLLDGRTVELRAHNLFVATSETVTETLLLVFRSRDEIERDLAVAGFEVEAVFGDWRGALFDGASPLMVFVARAV